MILFIIILCLLWTLVGWGIAVVQESGEPGSIVLTIVLGLILTFVASFNFFIIKGDEYFKPVYRDKDNVVYRDTQYGRVDTVLYIINKDTVYYDEID
jgi:hypothetical protein